MTYTKSALKVLLAVASFSSDTIVLKTTQIITVKLLNQVPHANCEEREHNHKLLANNYTNELY